MEDARVRTSGCGEVDHVAVFCSEPKKHKVSFSFALVPENRARRQGYARKRDLGGWVGCKAKERGWDG